VFWMARSNGMQFG